MKRGKFSRPGPLLQENSEPAPRIFFDTRGRLGKIPRVKICFVETESLEQEYFQSDLGGAHELEFVDTLEEASPEAQILSVFVHSRVTPAFMDAHPALKLIATRSTGFDHIAVAEAAARGIAVSRVPNYGENTVAEHSFALLLALSRRLRESFAAYSRNRISYQALRGFDLKGKTFGIVGTGRIGLHAARIALGFQMEVLAYDVKTQPLVAATLDFEYVSFEELLRRSDVISLYIPLLPETRHVINRESLARCKQGVVIINTARGPLIDTVALLEALESGQVGGAGLDVLEDERVLHQQGTRVIGEEIVSHLQRSASADDEPLPLGERIEELRGIVTDSRLLDRHDVIFTPHSAFNSREAVARIDEQTVRSIRQFIEGHPVNLAPRGVPDAA
jgi:D-lactate dehydrogenase